MIAKNIDVKLNVRPIYIGLVHEYAYEGPCRFGEGDALEKEYDQMVSRETYEIFKQDVFFSCSGWNKYDGSDLSGSYG